MCCKLAALGASSNWLETSDASTEMIDSSNGHILRPMDMGFFEHWAESADRRSQLYQTFARIVRRSAQCTLLIPSQKGSWLGLGEKDGPGGVGG